MILSGLLPGNPLGFLCGLGTLRVLDTLEPGVWKLRWGQSGELQGKEYSEDDISKMIVSQILKKDLLLDCENPNNTEGYEKFLRFVKEQTGDLNSQRRYYDFASSISALDKKGDVKDTIFRFVTGNATLFNTAQNLNECIRKQNGRIFASLFQTWDYVDQGNSFDWDPVSYQREHAKSITKPSGSFNPSMYGANRLAFEGMSLFPTFLTIRGVETVGWKDKVFRWPAWKEFAGLDEIRGLLSMDYEHFKRQELERIGIDVYCSNKIVLSSGKHFRLGPGRICLPRN